MVYDRNQYITQNCSTWHQSCYSRYKHEVNDALQHFNQARKDSEWGERALFCMIEVCLNPESDMIAGEMLKPVAAAEK